jgi:hypothetical protein
MQGQAPNIPSDMKEFGIAEMTYSETFDEHAMNHRFLHDLIERSHLGIRKLTELTRNDQSMSE